jgi:sucrose-6F-phosphate phosphohydrolase
VKKCKLLISDVDFTLLGDDRALDRFANWLGQNRECIQFVLTSGRFCDSIEKSIGETSLPQPDFIIGGVGTEIREYATGKPVEAWTTDRFDNWDAGRVHRILSELERLQPQDEAFQSRYKISYFLEDATAGELELVLQRLREHSLDAGLVYSSQRDLDVLPARCDKGTSARFLAEYLGYAATDVIVCGDSANDLAMYRQAFCGIVVGNAHPELLALNGPRVFKSLFHCAAGVLDGLHYWLEEADRTAVPAGGCQCDERFHECRIVAPGLSVR